MAFKFPPNWQLKKAYLRQQCKLRKKSVGLVTDEYEQGTESFAEYSVLHCEIQPVTSEDLVWMAPGILDIGDARAWFEEFIQMKKWNSTFEDFSLYVYDSSKISVADGQASLRVQGADPCYPYATDNPTIATISGCTFPEPLLEFKVTEVIPLHTNIKYILSGDDGITYYWWNGTSWAVSDGTYAKSNTSTEIIAHILTLPFTSGTFRWKAFLHSDDGTATPELKELETIFGVKIEVDDQVIDHKNKRYRIDQIIDYYTKDGVLLKECYLKKIVGEN
jgi:hypothetical protein